MGGGQYRSSVNRILLEHANKCETRPVVYRVTHNVKGTATVINFLATVS